MELAFLFHLTYKYYLVNESCQRFIMIIFCLKQQKNI